MKDAKILFEDGAQFSGQIFTKNTKDRIAEVIFNTALTGYQEVLTDPSYNGQFVAFTYPQIGNYGINSEDMESRQIFLEGIIVREYCPWPSNWRSNKTVKDFLDHYQVVGIEGVDTRALTRYIREKGAQKALITASKEPVDSLIRKLQKAPGMKGFHAVKHVSCGQKYEWTSPAAPAYKVAVLDCGVKYMILRQLADAGCQCTVYPYTVSADTLTKEGYDGVFISNGPGDPEVVNETIATLQALMGKLPMFGICLGHQLLGLALGGRTYKLEFGHHGSNQPVKNLRTGQVEITAQNHGFSVDPASLDPKMVEITHINLNDHTVEGLRHKTLPVFSVQYHPEAAPGPHDSHYLFTEFIELMKTAKPIQIGQRL